jgi:hypothetical protein
MTDIPPLHEHIQRPELWDPAAQMPDTPPFATAVLDAAGTVLRMANDSLQASSRPAIHQFKGGERLDTGGQTPTRNSLFHVIVDSRIETDDPDRVLEFMPPADDARTFDNIGYLMGDWEYAGRTTRYQPQVPEDGHSTLYVRESLLMVPRRAGLVGMSAANLRGDTVLDAQSMRTLPPSLDVGKPYEVPRSREGLFISHRLRVVAASIVVPSLQIPLPRQRRAGSPESATD